MRQCTYSSAVADDSLRRIFKSGDLCKTVIDAMPCGIMIFDRDHKVHFLNDFLEKCLQVSARELGIGRTAGEILGCTNLQNHQQNTCGKTPGCQKCIIQKAAQQAISKCNPYRGEGPFHFTVNGQEHSQVFLISSAPLAIKNKKYALITIENLSEVDRYNNIIRSTYLAEHLIGSHPKMAELNNLLKEAAHTDLPVLLLGESGTGKELAAKAIHYESPRKSNPFITINCAAIPEHLLESELFGHVKGSFTGAVSDKKGRFELAEGGTLFLDEIGELPIAMQTKMLRFLQEGTFERVGDTRTIHVNVRILSATNRDLEKEITAGNFRLDLYYRLCVVPVLIPPLRERKTDIPLLTDHFLSRYDKNPLSLKKTITEETLNQLGQYSWPGNIRELQNIVQFLLMKGKTKREITPDLLPEHLQAVAKKGNTVGARHIRRKKDLHIRQIDAALENNKGNKVLAAKELGISRATLYRRLNNH